MEADRKKKLIALGPEVLATALLELSVYVDAADDLVERLIATSKENIHRYQAKLAYLKRRQRYISWNESDAFAHELIMLLEDLKSGAVDPRTGVNWPPNFIGQTAPCSSNVMIPAGLWAMYSTLTPKNSLSPMHQNARTSNG